MPTVEFNDDKPALDYIRKKGYASYSSITNVRDCKIPTKVDEVYFKFGRELHSRLLENKVLEKLSAKEEQMLAAMLAKLRANAVVKQLLSKSLNEQWFPKGFELHGLRITGRIDILNGKDNVCDLKTTRLTNMKAFVESMDMVQASLYKLATGVKDFYYIGCSKLPPHNVMVFNVNQYPDKIKEADKELIRLIRYIKSKL